MILGLFAKTSGGRNVNGRCDLKIRSGFGLFISALTVIFEISNLQAVPQVRMLDNIKILTILYLS